jgi:hypothetical protein
MPKYRVRSFTKDAACLPLTPFLPRLDRPIGMLARPAAIDIATGERSMFTVP